MSKKKKKSKDASYNKQSMRIFVVQILEQNPDKSYDYTQLCKRLKIRELPIRQLLVEVCAELVKDEYAKEVQTGRFRYFYQAVTVEGVVEMTQSGNAYIVCPERTEDIFVAQHNQHQALHGDTVKVELTSRKKKRAEGVITEIIKRARETWVGTLEVSKNHAFLVTDNRNMPYALFIPLKNLNGGKNGQKAVAKIVEWKDEDKNPTGLIVDVLGDAGENETEIHAILADFELPSKFPASLEKEAKRIDAGITPDEVAKRRDFREITTFTIDPFDAKDFDDALSIRKLENGNWEVGVHIADVTFYVNEGGAIEKEAQERATSVYLVDRVVPMLPEHLSNFICSLRPNEEKLTYSAVFELNEEAQILNQWFGRTVINSNRRFTYEEAQEIIETGVGDFAEDVLTLDRLAKKLRAKRFETGSVDFDRAEVKFKLDENGKPLEVFFKHMKDSNRLIEDFMLLANQKVAEVIGLQKNKVFVYRIHDMPNMEKLVTLAKFVKKFGYHLEIGTPQQVTKSLNKLLDEVQGKGEEDIIEQLAIRTMAKAVYSTKNIGHYGLGFKHYTHFTSPIRRYPDMMVHRLLEKYLSGGRSVTEKKYEALCMHSSDREVRAAQAERASTKYKQVEYMQDKLGQVFDAIISGVTEWGLYVEIIESKIEGMVSIRDIDDDSYKFDEKNYCITGHRTKKRFQLGGHVRVQVVRTNLQKRQLDFMLV